jgi:hypothetical protein
MDRDRMGWRRLGTGLAIVAIVLSACKASAPSTGAGASGAPAGASAPPAGSAGTVNLAVNP